MTGVDSEAAAVDVDQAAVPSASSAPREFDRTRVLLAAAVVTAVLAAAASADDRHVLLAAIAVVQAALILGWVFGSGMPGRIGAVLIAVAAAAGADVAVNAWPTSALSPLLAPLGLGILVMFIHQLTRGVVRARVVESLSGVATVLVAAIALTAFAQLRNEFEGRSMAIAAVLASGGAVAIGLLADLVWSRPRFDPEVPRGLLSVVVGGAAGAAVGGWVLRDSDQLTTSHAVLICAGLAVLSVLVSVGTAFIGYGLGEAPAAPSSEFAVVHRPRPVLRPLPEAIIPIALVAPAAYVLFLSVS